MTALRYGPSWRVRHHARPEPRYVRAIPCEWTMEAGEAAYHLRTLGHPVLTRRDGALVEGLRRKDLALLAYLTVEGPRVHPRGRLATLLWGESDEARARHSLTQAIGRIQRATGRAALVVERDTVRSTGAVASDAELLVGRLGEVDDLVGFYEGPFLEGFEAGFGSEEFDEWAGRRRAELRGHALRWLDRRGGEAEERGDWARALRIAERAVQIDPVWERGHRRAMRALLELGERNRALRHFLELERWLADEVGGEPDPETLELVGRIRAAPARPTATAPDVREPSTPFVPPAPETAPETAPAEAAGSAGSTAAEDDGESSIVAPVRSSIEGSACDPPGAVNDARGDDADAAPSPSSVERGEEAEETGEEGAARAEPVVSLAIGAGGEAAEGANRRRVRRLLGRGVAAGSASLVVVAVCLAVRALVVAAPAARAPGDGEAIRVGRHGAVYLAYGHALWLYPDSETLARCLNGWTRRVRRVQRLPDWPRRTLASVRMHAWQGGLDAVLTDDPSAPTQHVAVGCVLAPIPDPLTFRAIFGHTDWTRSQVELDSVLRASPHTTMADPYPLRASGTLIQGASDSVKWVVYHGGALTVDTTLLRGYCRTPREVVRVTDAEFHYYRAAAALPPASPPCRAPPRR